jgi:hypothetical protein
VLSVTILFMTGTCFLNAITLDFSGNISIPNYTVVLCKVHNALHKSLWSLAEVHGHLQTTVQ